jgi:hypothetical protein
MKRLLFFRARSVTTRFVAATIGLLTLIGHVASGQPADDSAEKAVARNLQDLDPTTANAAALVEQSRQIFRFDTFGDETYWGDMLNLHLTIEGARFGGRFGPQSNGGALGRAENRCRRATTRSAGEVVEGES